MIGTILVYIVNSKGNCEGIGSHVIFVPYSDSIAYKITQKKWHSFVGTYSSTMEHLGFWDRSSFSWGTEVVIAVRSIWLLSSSFASLETRKAEARGIQDPSSLRNGEARTYDLSLRHESFENGVYHLVMTNIAMEAMAHRNWWFTY